MQHNKEGELMEKVKRAAVKATMLFSTAKILLRAFNKITELFLSTGKKYNSPKN